MTNVIPKPTVDVLKIFIEQLDLMQQNGKPYLQDKKFLETMEKL